MPLIFGPQGDGKTKIVNEEIIRGNSKFVNGETVITIPSEDVWWADLTDKKIGNYYDGFLNELASLSRADPSLFIFFNPMPGPFEEWFDNRKTTEDVLLLIPSDGILSRNYRDDPYNVNLPKFTLTRALDNSDSLNRFGHRNNLTRIRAQVDDSSHDLGQQTMLRFLINKI